MSRTSWDILADMPDMDVYYISADGGVSKQPGRNVLIEAEFTDSKRSTVPKEVEDFLMKNGVADLASPWLVRKRLLKLRRCSDGVEIKVELKHIVLVCRPNSGERLRAIGFSGRKNYDAVWLNYISRKEYLKFIEFIRESGVKFEDGTPPWMKCALSALDAKASARRPGREEARFFGFG